MVRSNTPSQYTWCRKGWLFIFYISGPFVSAIFGRMMLCEIVCVIVCPFVPKEEKLLLSLMVPEPIVSHIPRFRYFLVNVVVYEAVGCRVIYLYGCGWLYVI